MSFFFLLSYHTMSKTCEPLAASVKHFEKIACAHAWMCLCVCGWHVCAARVVETRRFLCQQIHIVAFQGPIILICWNVNFLLKPSYERKSWLCRTSSWAFFFPFGIAMIQYLCCAASILHKILFPGECSVRVKRVCVWENKTDMRPWLWQERIQAGLREKVLFLFFFSSDQMTEMWVIVFKNRK